jgi:hypothetical protein
VTAVAGSLSCFASILPGDALLKLNLYTAPYHALTLDAVPGRALTIAKIPAVLSHVSGIAGRLDLSIKLLAHFGDLLDQSRCVGHLAVHRANRTRGHFERRWRRHSGAGYEVFVKKIK